LAHAAAARHLLPRFAAQGLEMTPPIRPRAARALAAVAPRLPAGARMEARADALVFSPAGAPKGRVALHESCVMEALFPRVHHETVRLLVLAGCEVVVPRAQTCCGALHAHAGLRRDAKRLARANGAAFAGDCEFVVSHSAGCGAALREGGHLLAGEPSAAAAESLATRARDVSEVLAHFGLPPAPPRPAPLRVAYHDACHLAHAQRVREAPRRLLRALPGVRFVELPDSDWCCGSAGTYNLTHPDMADAQLAGKLAGIARVAPDVVVASNPGCLLHMHRGLAGRAGAPRLLHLVELLGEAYPAPGE
ncbi:MAG TPA: (Fe-S)-binding protein, partial [Candidatus Eisenbacteria bacterium]|nr:(Fe-S)-binding protein [Candidatus Eisenbacteria bacterium]